MTAAKSTLTAERLRELLHYDPETGIFTWYVLDRRRKNPAGCAEHRGYLTIGIDRRRYYSHRLAWLYTKGVWPIEEIDHIDTNKANNRFANLREATHAINEQNQRIPQKNNSSGFLGVYLEGRRYRARIKLGGKNIHIGCFDTAEEAGVAYIEAKKKLHVGCTL